MTIPQGGLVRAATRRRLRFFISILIATGGALLGSMLGRASLIGTLVSAIDAVLVLGTIVAVEIFLPQTRRCCLWMPLWRSTRALASLHGPRRTLGGTSLSDDARNDLAAG